MKFPKRQLREHNCSTVFGTLAAIFITLTISPCFADSSSYDGVELTQPAVTSKQTPSGLQPTIAGLLAPGSFVGQTGYGYDSASGYTQGYQGLPPTCLAPIDINIGY
jgi:hypothetical protein